MSLWISGVHTRCVEPLALGVRAEALGRDCRLARIVVSSAAVTEYIFEWDPEKAASNVRKHGVTFEEASLVFRDPHAESRYDDEHSSSEADGGLHWDGLAMTYWSSFTRLLSTCER